MKLSLSEAYTTLNIAQGSTVDEAKTSYRRLALQHHPDKNDNSEESTMMFQRVSAAYEKIQQHFTEPEPEPFRFGGGGGGGFGGHTHAFGGGMGGHSFFTSGGASYAFGPAAGAYFGGGGGGGGYYDDSEDDEDDYDDYDSEEDDDEYDDYGRGGPSFFEFMFQDIFSGGTGSRHAYNTQAAYRRRHEQPERTEQQKAWDEQRRKKENMTKEEREEEKAKGAQRRDNKINAKRAAALAEKESAALRARQRQQAAQDKRSKVFAAARAGDAKGVRKGVYEEDVAADGGEWLKGMEPTEEEVKKEEVPAQVNGGQGGKKGKGKKGKKGKGQTAESVVEEKENTQPAPDPTPAATGIGNATAAGTGGKKKKNKKKKGANGTANGSPDPSSAATSQPQPQQNGQSKPQAPQQPQQNGQPKPKPAPTPASKPKTDPKETLLHIAVRKGDEELVRWLCDHGALPEERDSASFTPLHLSLQLGHTGIASFLLSEYPLPSIAERSDADHPPPGETLLSLSVTSGSAATVELVLDLEDDIADVRGNFDWVQEMLISGKGRPMEEREKWEEVCWALAGKKGWTPPEGYRRRRGKRPVGAGR